MGGCFGVNSKVALSRVEHVVGKNGYYDWYKMPAPLSYEELELPNIEPEEQLRIAKETLDSALEYFKSCFDNDGDCGFDEDIIDEVLKSLALTKIKHIFDFAPTSEYGYEKVSVYLDEVIVELEKNEILASTVAIAKKLGVELYYRQETEVEKQWIRRTVTYSYVLHIITKTCLNQKGLLRQLADHYAEERKNGALKGWRDTVESFLYMKIISVDTPVDIVAYNIDKKFKPGHYPWTPKASFGLSLNILEAMWEDQRVGNLNNAEAGYELALLHGLFDYTRKLNRARIQAKPYHAMYKYSPVPRNWADLYQSWNLNFVHAHFHKTGPVVIAKLFNPAVGSYSHEPETYITPRVISLYLELNRILIERTGVYKSNLPPVRNWVNDDFIQLWSKVNLHFAKRYRAFYDDLGKYLAGEIRETAEALGDSIVRKTWNSFKKAVEEKDDERVVRFITKLIGHYHKSKLKTDQNINVFEEEIDDLGEDHKERIYNAVNNAMNEGSAE